MSFTFQKNLRGTFAGATPFLRTPMHVVLCDVEPLIIARHLVHLQLLAGFDAFTAAHAAMLWECMYSVVLPARVGAMLQVGGGDGNRFRLRPTFWGNPFVLGCCRYSRRTGLVVPNVLGQCFCLGCFLL